jgi:hypothetical protein
VHHWGPASNLIARFTKATLSCSRAQPCETGETGEEFFVNCAFLITVAQTVGRRAAVVVQFKKISPKADTDPF